MSKKNEVLKEAIKRIEILAEKSPMIDDWEGGYCLGLENAIEALQQMIDEDDAE